MAQCENGRYICVGSVFNKVADFAQYKNVTGHWTVI